MEPPLKEHDIYKNRRGRSDRRIAFRRLEDIIKEQLKEAKRRKLQSFLELGQLIGLDLDLDGMLSQIARKATEVMEAERFSIFLYDQAKDELWTKVAVGLAGKEIRLPSRLGVAGYSFHTGQTVNLTNAYSDPRFYREIDEETNYHTKTLLSMPFYSRSGQALGVIQLVNKKDGVFTPDDETYLRTFSNHAAVFIEMAQLQRARIEALEQSKEEVVRLNRAKGKALDHLSHELRTPLALIQGITRLLKRRLANQGFDGKFEGFFGTFEKNLTRLLEIQQETDKIIRTYHEIEGEFLLDELDRLWRRVEDVSQIPASMRTVWYTLKKDIIEHIPHSSAKFKNTKLFPLMQQTIKEVKSYSSHRDIRFQLTGEKNLNIIIDPAILKEIIIGLLKNAVENSPDGGSIHVKLEPKGRRTQILVQDFGIGITSENKKHIFDGLFHTQDTDMYGSKKPYDFNAGGKGLDLLLMKMYGERFGFNVAVESKRCIYSPTDKDVCPGKISLCAHCQKPEDCMSAGGSTFYLTFPVPGADITQHQ